MNLKTFNQLQLFSQFADIAKEIQTQCEAIISKFNVHPKYIILGTESKQIADLYIASQLIVTGEFGTHGNEIIKPYMELNFGLTPVITEDAPKNLIQVVVPTEAYL